MRFSSRAAWSRDLVDFAVELVDRARGCASVGCSYVEYSAKACREVERGRAAPAVELAHGACAMRCAAMSPKTRLKSSS